MEYSLSWLGCCSVALQMLPAPTHPMNLPERLPLPHPFSPQRQIFTVPRHLSINSCIELRRTPYKKPKTYWKPFSNMGAKPSLDM